MGWAAAPGRWFNLFLLFSPAGTGRRGGCGDGWVGLSTAVRSARLRSGEQDFPRHLSRRTGLKKEGLWTV